MSGGKGSRPRPFSISQEEYGNRFDAIFGKTKHADSVCYCYNCNIDRITESGLPYTMSQMILCPICSNKRCPHATDHNLACTNSNDPGQPGSRY